MRRTLVLNAGFEPLVMISWQRAICLLLTSKAEVVAEYTEIVVRSVSAQVNLPSVIRLNRYVRPTLFASVRLNRRNILARDNHTCQYCSKELKGNQATLDHVIPRSKGGKTTWENVVTACVQCNCRKGDRLLEHSTFKLIRAPRRPKLKEIFLRRDAKYPDEWVEFLT